MASQVSMTVRYKCKHVFTAKEKTATIQDDLLCAHKATADGLKISGLIVSPWDAGDTDVSFFFFYVKGFYYSFISTSKQRSMNECCRWGWTRAIKHKCPLYLQLQQVNRQDQRLVLLIKAHGLEKSTLESFQASLERYISFFSTLYSIQWKELDCHSCLFILRALCDGRCAYRGLWAHGIVWHVARKAFFQPDRRSERDAGPAPEVNHLIRCYFTLKLACTLRITL